VDANAAARNWDDWTFSTEHRNGPFVDLTEEPYALGNFSPRDFSMKTGVEYVGQNNQGQALHKDIIGDWLIGCLRSDYITMVDKTLKPPKDGLIVLTELITITEKTTRAHPHAGSVSYKEGVQIRDISALDSTKAYLAPLNIPFVGPDAANDFKTSREEFYFLTDAVTETDRLKWSDFWKVAYGSALGRTKALFLLRYGLQIMNPNVQNFLIEFDRKGAGLEPTNTMAIRDLNDASVVREIVWALFNGPGLPPQAESDTKRLAELDVKTFKFEFTEGRMAAEGFGYQGSQETGSSPQSFGPSGIQFLWQRFSAFATGFKPQTIKDDPAINNVWKNLLWAMSDWGMAHDKSYINTVEKHLGLNFRQIDWNRYPDPTRFQRMADISAAETKQTINMVGETTDPGRLSIANCSLSNFPMMESAWNTQIDNARTPFNNTIRGGSVLLISGMGFDPSIKVSVGGTEVADNELVFYRNGRIGVWSNDRLRPNVVLVNRKEAELTIVKPGPTVTAKLKPVAVVTELSELGWEEMSAKVIHDYLAGIDGQTALKACRDRKWALVNPRFTIRLTKAPDNSPFAWQKVFMKKGAAQWTDLTNRKGELYVYNDQASDIMICPKRDNTTVIGGEWLPCQNAVWHGITISVS